MLLRILARPVNVDRVRVSRAGGGMLQIDRDARCAQRIGGSRGVMKLPAASHWLPDGYIGTVGAMMPARWNG
jgi:hypothetical protein